MNVNTGRHYSVRQIHFSGQDTSPDSVLQREIHPREGTWLNAGKVRQGKTH
ncbi:POTRA domain-containing protein [Kosakonia arachidis]|uniref:POTRA domain-containing protein n=1 Tax=Kosakonia arachidis TaxID=551989 RepID=UPI00349E5F01